jgi:outer membrane protein assembly factor BamB
MKCSSDTGDRDDWERFSKFGAKHGFRLINGAEFLGWVLEAKEDAVFVAWAPSPLYAQATGTDQMSPPDAWILYSEIDSNSQAYWDAEAKCWRVYPTGDVFIPISVEQINETTLQKGVQAIRFWQIGLLCGAFAIAGILGWQYADRRIATLLALDTTTEKLDWVHPVSPDLFYSRGAIAAEGKVLVNFCTQSERRNCDHAYLQALDVESGKVLWTYQPSHDESAYEIVSNPSVVFQHNQLYMQVGQELRSLDPSSGRQRWAIKRPWFAHKGVQSGLGLVTHSGGMTVIRTNNHQRILQSLNPQTGAVVRQFTVQIPQLSTTRDLIAASEDNLYLEQSKLTALGSGEFFDYGQSSITAYDLKTDKAQFYRAILGPVERMQVTQNRLYISTFDHTSYSLDSAPVIQRGRVLALDGDSGRVLWPKSKEQFNCIFGDTWIVDADSIYLNCVQKVDKGEATQMVAAAAATGQVKWQVQTNPIGYSEFLPITVNGKVLLTFRKKSASQHSTQVLGLDRNTGSLLCSFALYDDQFVDRFRSVVAAEGGRLFVLDKIPRWQIWLLLWNRSLWLSQYPSKTCD